MFLHSEFYKVCDIPLFIISYLYYPIQLDNHFVVKTSRMFITLLLW